jgi:SAM-dependent methyltransferase
LTEAVTPLFKALSSHRRRLCGSEYLRDGTGRGKRNAQGIQHQDVTQLTFPDEAFNVIGSFEVLEHVPAYTRALCELSRCLRPGGTLLLTVPFILSSATTLTRATIDDAGQVTHLLPPEIHGDPLDDTGALCFYHFGWDFLDQLAEVGLEDTSISMFWEPHYGYLGGYQFIITARKQASPKRWASLLPILQRAFGASAAL